ncbi:MAG: PSD1 domain-containing protein [Verrucomicrobiales bacterium]|nr:PSD1 domain-containing protein [Verrucomicrobiales bacterium]
MKPSFFLNLVLLGGIAPATGAETRATAAVDFVREVRPIFEKHCYECHGEAKQKSGLRLDVKAAALRGGDNHGPDIVPGRAAESPLIRFLTTDDEDERMPPEGRLSAEEIATLTRWVNEGAVWPDGVDLAQLEDRTDHWSFRPLSRSPVPSEEGGSAIDAYIDARLAQAGLRRSPEAEPADWLRRVTFDLTGLPPTPEEVADFLSERDPAAVVDRLLASPRHGERWAQHWLDVVRYADTHGFEVNTERPNAWPYRDYVIRAFNEDTPYDRFIREQIVGDALGEDAATGFLVTASVLLPGQIGKDAPSMRLARQDSIDEIVMNIGQTFLGLSVGCARCHDHKFDPITSRDYYAMQAFVAGVEYADRPMNTPEAVAKRREIAPLKEKIAAIEQQLGRLVPLARPGGGVAEGRPPRPTVHWQLTTDRFAPVRARKLRFTVLATNGLEPCIDELEVFNRAGRNVARATPGVSVVTSGDKRVPNRHDPSFINDGRHGNSSSWMSNEMGRGWVEVTFAAEEEIERVLWSRDREGRFDDRLATEYRIEVDSGDGWLLVADSTDRRPYVAGAPIDPVFSDAGLPADEAAQARALLAEKGTLERRLREAETGQLAFAGKFREPDDIRLLNRGDPEQPGDAVAPAVLSALGNLSLPPETAEQERRRVLADWIASPENPLTARVMVNRIWQGHFGEGLVETPSDFGRGGMAPSHPELFDWLAAEFIRSGWSVKHLHRLIVLSGTYRQSSAITAENQHALGIDAEARLLWRYPGRRLEAEAIRDAMLAVSGRLNLAMYGRGFDLFDKRGGLSGFKPVETHSPVNERRLIYAHKVRRESEAVFGAFDCPDAGQSTAIRRASTTPIQALNLFNSRFTLDQAAAFAERVRREAGDGVEAQVRGAYRLALGRDPVTEELGDAASAVSEHGLVPLCRALFNANEFLFVP